MASISKYVQLLKLLKNVRELEGLTKNEKLLLLTLATIGDPDGTNVHPGHAYLARCTGLAERTVRRLIGILEAKGYLMDDGRLKYVRQYILNIPGIRPKSLAISDIPQEEWEEMWEPEEDDTPTEKRPAVTPPPPPPDDETVKTPAISAEEKRRKDLEFLWTCIDQARRGVPTMTYQRFMQAGHRKGIEDDYLDWMWNYEEDVGKTDSSKGSQPDESVSITNFPQTRSIYQP